MSSRLDDIGRGLHFPKSLDSVVDSLAAIVPSVEACRCRIYGELIIHSYEDLQRVSILLAVRISHILNSLGKTHDAMRPIGICMVRGFGWYALYIAAVRLGVPVAPMTQDIANKLTAADRNREIISSLRPFLVVTDSDTPSSVSEQCSWRGISNLRYSELFEMTSENDTLPVRFDPHQVPLAYLYTGGTTSASKCVLISHAMAMSEMRGYPEICGDNFLTGTSSVLQHSSTYWGATFLGQIDIALALGGSVVFSSVIDHQTIQQDNITVLGLVPSQLAALDHSVLPSLRLVFTWGEKLPKKLAKKWTNVLLVDLLVSTEYWLCLYALNGEDSFRKTASVVLDQSPDGTLMLGGPCVTPFGYSDALLNAILFNVGDVIRSEYSQFLLRTSDRVQFLANDRLRFLGRADTMMKIGGEWVDLDQLAASLEKIPNVDEVCIFEAKAFIVVNNAFDETTLHAIKRIVNEEYVSVEFVTEIIRHPVTQKVDRNAHKQQQNFVCENARFRRIKTLFIWASIQTVIVAFVYIVSGLLGLAVLPYCSRLIAKLLKQCGPLHTISVPICLFLLFPPWLLLATCSLFEGIRCVDPHWAVCFYLGLPRQVQLWWSYNPSIAWPGSACRTEPTSFVATRFEKIWEPYGPRTEYQLERRRSWIGVSELSLSEEEASNIGQTFGQRLIEDHESTISNGYCDVWSIIARVLSIPISGSTFLTSVSSLAAVEIANLLREEGWELSVSDVLQSRTVADLASKLRRREKIAAVPMTTNSVKFRCQLWCWGLPCSWLFEVSVPRDRAFHMQALSALMQRHSAFRVKLIDSVETSYWMNEVLVVFGLLRWMSSSWLNTLLGPSVFACWNKVAVDPTARPYLAWQETRLNSLEELRNHMLWKKKRSQFYTPFETEIIRVGNRQFLRLFLTHAFSDGSSVVPILKDLNNIYAGNGNGSPDCGLAVQESRLFHSLTSPEQSDTDMYLCYNLDLDDSVSPESFGRMVVLDESFVAVAHRAAQRLTCPIDVLFLTALGLAQHDAANRSSIALALIVPLRDGASDTVGFLADQRNLDVPMGPKSSLLSLVTTVHRMCRRREWTIPAPFTNCTRTLVNIVQGSFPSNAALTQELYLQQLESASGFVYRPMEIYLEQVDQHLWTLKARCRRAEFTVERFDSFLGRFRQIVIECLTAPTRAITHLVAT